MAKIAFLFTDGVEQVELTHPLQAAEDAGHDTVLLTLEPGTVQAFDHLDHGDTFDVDRAVADADPSEFDALVVPGGVANGDFLRADEDAVAFVRAFVEAGRPTAVICHGPWVLAEADVIRGRRLTSYPSLQTDLRNAGGEWVDEQLVEDDNLITSRKPDDLEAFTGALLRAVDRVTA